jgi:hypothetical protein
MNSAEYQAGKTAISNAKTIMSDVPSELASFMTSAGGTQTDKRLSNAESTLRTSDNLDQLLGSLQVIRQAGLERQKGYIGVNPYLRFNYGDMNNPITKQPIKSGWASQRVATQGSGGPQPPVAGAIAGRDAKGNIVAWKLPDGTVQKIGQ